MKRSSSDSSRTPPAKRTHFIEDILGHTPSPRPTRTHFIEDILEMRTQRGSGIENYVKHLQTEVAHNKIFKTTTCKTTLMITDLPADPEELLAKIFESAIDNAKDESLKHGIAPTHLGCIISSVLLDPHIYIPIRVISENTVEAILNRFLQIGQSKKQDNTSLLGEPFSIKVTTLNRHKLKQRKFAGSGGRRTHAAFHHRVAECNLIKVTTIKENLPKGDY